MAGRSPEFAAEAFVVAVVGVDAEAPSRDDRKLGDVDEGQGGERRDEALESSPSLGLLRSSSQLLAYSCRCYCGK